MEPFDLVGVLAGPTVIAVSATIAWKAFKRSQHLSLFQKCVDTVAHCNTRYEALIVDMSQKSKSEKMNAEVFFRKYWGLQSDQIDYFLLGLVDPLTFTAWNVSLIRHFRDQRPIFGEMTFADGWRNIGRPKGAESEIFVRYIDKLLEKADAEFPSLSDRQYAFELARDVYDRPEVQRFRSHMMERDPTYWDWNLQIFRPAAPRLD